MSTATVPVPSPALSSERIRPVARASSERLARFADRDLDVKIAGTNETLTLPAEAVRLLVDLLAQLAEGNAVTLTPYHAELTTQQAADFLGVSRPFLVKQLEEGAIPFRKVGTHRRIRFEDLLAYKKSTYEKRLKALEGLAELDQELGLR
jgi:excisionase family DNA binding protein